MKEQNTDILLDLLCKKAIDGLDEAEQKQLDSLSGNVSTDEFHSFEATAAAISMIGISTDEPLPQHLFSKILADSQKYVQSPEPVAETPWPPTYKDVGEGEKRSNWFGWLGWAVAAAACVALAVNIFVLPRTNDLQARNTPPIEEPKIPTVAELRDAMMQSKTGVVKANWAPANPKDPNPVSGDVVWSDEKQAGYMRFKGLPVNDAQKETYQLWIFDKTQDKATPIDGGTFDVSSSGEVIIPINAKLKARGPEMFAITVEKPGGVVVSKREKMAALAKVETPSA